MHVKGSSQTKRKAGLKKLGNYWFLGDLTRYLRTKVGTGRARSHQARYDMVEVHDPPFDDPWIPDLPLPLEEPDLFDVHLKAKERRSAARHRFTELIEIDGQMAFGWDRSETGLGVYVRIAPAIGAEVVASLGRHPDFGGETQFPMRVVRMQVTTQGYLVGLQRR